MTSERRIPPTSAQIKVVEASLEFDILQRLFESGQAGLQGELKRFEEMMERDLVGLDYHSQGDHFADVNDEYIEIAETLPRLYGYSQFVLAYSFFEKSLNDVCSALRNDCGYKLSFKELSDQGISRSKNYLVKVCNITGVFDGKAWESAKTFGDIRNAIVHRHGFVDYVPIKSDSLHARLSKIEGLELKQELANQEDAQIAFDGPFVVKSIAIYREIISAIGIAIRESSSR
jgi:hypothetical protein